MKKDDRIHSKPGTKASAPLAAWRRAKLPPVELLSLLAFSRKMNETTPYLSLTRTVS